MRRALLIPVVLLWACGDDDAPDDEVDAGGRDAALEGGMAGAPADASRPVAGSDGGRTDGGGRGPMRLVLEGTAAGTANDEFDAGPGGSVECRISAVIEELDFEPNGDLVGVISGELFRTTTVGDAAFEFAPLIAGPVSLRHTSPTQVELRFVGDQPDDALPFWQQLEVVTGTETGARSFGGEWVCAPGLLGDQGFGDIDLTVGGVWTLEPAM